MGMPFQSMAPTRIDPLHLAQRSSTLAIEALEIDAGVEHDLLGASPGHLDPVHVREQTDCVVERPLDCCPHQPPLDLVAVDALRELELGVEGVNAPIAPVAVAHPGDGDLTEQRDQAAHVHALVCVEDRTPIGRAHAQRCPHVPRSAPLDMLLEQEAMDFLPAALDLALDGEQPQALAGVAAQPALQIPKRPVRGSHCTLSCPCCLEQPRHCSSSEVSAQE